MESKKSPATFPFQTGFLIYIYIYIYIKVKLSRHRPGQALGVPAG
jgi:hypothetical protein